MSKREKGMASNYSGSPKYQQNKPLQKDTSNKLILPKVKQAQSIQKEHNKIDRIGSKLSLKSLHITPVKPRKLGKDILNEIREGKQKHLQKNTQLQQENLLIHKLAVKHQQQKARSSVAKQEVKDNNDKRKKAPSPKLDKDFSKGNLTNDQSRSSDGSFRSISPLGRKNSQLTNTKRKMRSLNQDIHGISNADRKQLIEREYSKVFESKLSNIRELLSLNNEKGKLYEDLFSELYVSNEKSSKDPQRNENIFNGIKEYESVLTDRSKKKTSVKNMKNLNVSDLGGNRKKKLEDYIEPSHYSSKKYSNKAKAMTRSSNISSAAQETVQQGLPSPNKKRNPTKHNPQTVQSNINKVYSNNKKRSEKKSKGQFEDLFDAYKEHDKSNHQIYDEDIEKLDKLSLINAGARYELLNINQQLLDFDLNLQKLKRRKERFIARNTGTHPDKKDPMLNSEYDFNKEKQYENPVLLMQKRVNSMSPMRFTLKLPILN